MDWIRGNYSPFSRRLALNCGNGWVKVERELFAKRIHHSMADAYIDEPVPEQERMHAEALKLSALDLRLGINQDSHQDSLPRESFDLALNN